MNLTVTDQDIENATPGNAWMCALARAFQRQTGDASISVGCLTAGPDRELNMWSLRSDMREYMEEFDKERPVYPITFLNFDGKAVNA